MIGTLYQRNEWRVLRLHPMIWIALIVVALFSAAVVQGSPVDPEEGAGAALLWVNILFPMFMLPFFAGALAPIFYLREVDHDLTEMVGSYPLTPRQWLLMRVGSFTLIMLSASLLSQLLFATFLLPDFPGEGATLFKDGLKWLLVLQLPNCLLWASLLAFVASRKAHSGVLYFTAGMVWLGYNGIATLAGSPMIAGSFVPFEPLRQTMLLLDPYAGISLMSALPESGLLQSRDANIGVSRVFWLVIALLLLRGIKTVPMLSERKVAAKEKAARRNAKDRWSSHVGMHLRYVVRDKVFPLLMLGWIVLLLPEVLGGSYWVEPLSRVEPDSRDALNRVVWDIVLGAGALLMLYASDRICRLYSGTRMQELYAATAHRPLLLVTVQLASIWIVALFFMALAGFAIMVAQLVIQSAIQPFEYGVQLGLAFGRLALFGTFYVAIHGLIRQRFLANLSGLMLLVLALSPLLPILKLTHPLWRPMGTPLSSPDHYWGFGASLAGHWPFTLFWFALSAALLVIAVVRHHRTLPFVQQRFAVTARRPAMLLALTAFGVAGLQGAAIDRALRGEGALETPQQRLAWRAAYERDYAEWEHVPQPDVEAIQARVDFYPADQRALLHAKMTLLNRSDEPIREILVGRNARTPKTMSLAMENATLTKEDAVARQWIYALDRPLAPGERTTLSVDLEVQQSSLSSAAFPLLLRSSFNSLPAYVLLPFVGYRKEVILREAENREEQGLPPLTIAAPSELTTGAADRTAHDEVMLDTIITTDAGQEVVAQGRLVRRWQEGARTHFQFRTDQPIRAMPAFFSVPWEAQRQSHSGVSLQVFSPTKIAENDPNFLGMRDAIDLLGSEVAPYRGSSLSLLAVPDIGFTGYALPQIVQISHKFGFRAHPTEDAGFSHRYRRSAHEAAHQWFGHTIGYGVPEDRAFLIESLAKYAELVLIERRYGREAMEALVAYERERYRDATRDLSAPVSPLIDATENVDQYSRASIVFACLRQQIGDAPILAVAKRLARENGKASSSLDFISALIEETDPVHRPTIERLLIGTEPVISLLDEYRCQ